MKKWVPMLAIASGVALWTVPAGSTDPTTSDYFIGYWGLGTPEECVSRDTMSFYASGAWAMTNGGGNPVEVIGVWALEGDRILLDFAELDDISDLISVEATISNAGKDAFTLTAPELPDGQATLYRCE